MTMHRNFEANLHPEKLVFSPPFRLQPPRSFPQVNFEETRFRQDSGRRQALNQVGGLSKAKRWKANLLRIWLLP